MTNIPPDPNLFPKTHGKAANANPWTKGGKETIPAREEILEAIKLRLATKKKKR